MKKKLPKIAKIALIVLAAFFLFLIVVDKVILPYYVSAPELKLPDVVGKQKDFAIQLLKADHLNPIILSARYDENIPAGHIIYQKPEAGETVKENRRVYLYVSGGDPLVKMPELINKTVRDAKITLERLGLVLDSVEEVQSEQSANTIVSQQYPEGQELDKGTSVDIKVSIGPEVGMIRVPNILGKSLNEAEAILRQNSLRIGKKIYSHSPTLLPNTVVDQLPSESTLVSVGDSVDVVITESGSGDK